MLIQTNARIQLYSTNTPHKSLGRCDWNMKLLKEMLRLYPEGPCKMRSGQVLTAGIPLNCRQAKYLLSNGTGTVASGQKKGRIWGSRGVKLTEAGLEWELSPSPPPLVTTGADGALGRQCAFILLGVEVPTYWLDVVQVTVLASEK